ncbi:MAG: tRNA-specific 2-thiouridylase MnmA [Parcubacteria group bacterium GW2011_GWB1_35_5]|uniref:tRNA-specific 2-thiouridylase MnmA n=1 Tax=Candidatus Zambryskibacteria bacterium RIFCSPLOWO2_01_FULL_35_19 TaxID=1802757 RepID=A0A1G2TYI9_9BACT|nr:MAG: tRNA-specific 2-thiouridylase MnmA [Parcubacteria group bacterium GW2011_GWC1_34_10]KKP80394.1 MAG: tRNA-specific 2-thiouridylase MnmA [Parcubacteria group bacterium GW2011_GWB1_35_5]OHB01690.1 MAG: tRNA 2-thiouridine(34) synthase MnmA [Candidatus Zambryskibacteria bacterium RIFCSPLOWO2_01_FULL_35_19]
MKSQEQKNLKSRILNPKSKPRVFVGLSGGVDSAVSAALLKERGYAVTGVFIKAWTPEGYPCTWKEDRRSAMKVAAILDIPFITLDLEKEYKKEVVDYMIAEYKKGRTPNPDVMCNKEIKFGHFLKFALKNGANFVATGHYAKVLKKKLPKKVLEKNLTEAKPGSEDFSERSFFWQLSEGADKNKDQSYFLWTLTQKQLKHTLFPIGDLQKNEVRKLAGKFGLPQATKKDSQGLCFLGKIDMKEFLTRYITPKKGKVLLAPYSFSGAGNEKEEVIGHHKGALFFTIGERHGFTITKKTTDDSPLYVVSKNIKKNTITVAPKITPQPNSIQGESLYLKYVNIIGEIPSKKILCRIRYRQEKIKCQITPQKSKQQGEPLLQITFTKPKTSVSPGQSLVLYNNEICLGGGIIE